MNPNRRFHCFVVVVVTGLCFTVAGCMGTGAERRAQFDVAIGQAEATKIAAQLEINRRIADVKQVFDQQSAALESHVANLEAQLAARPDAAAEILPQIEQAKSIDVKIDATYNAITAKFEKISAEIFRTADEKIAALKAERESITSDDPGEQIKGVGNVIGSALPGQAGLIFSLLATSIGGIVSTIYQAKQKQNVRAAAVEAIGTMSTAIASGDVKLDDSARQRLQAAQSTAAKDMVDVAEREYSDVLKLIRKIAINVGDAVGGAAIVK